MAGQGGVVTIGHSTRSLEELLELLRSFRVTRLIDVRSAPGSRRHPHFGKDPLAHALAGAGIAYVHAKDLGGRRSSVPGSPHVGWRNESFRGYADHMDTPVFRQALDEVIAFAAAETIALMCAEAVPWRCHRQLIADALVARGIEVTHILGPGRSQPHRLTPFARLDGTRVVYDTRGGLFEDHLARNGGMGMPRNPKPR